MKLQNRVISPTLNKNELWRLTGKIDRLEVPWSLNDLQQKALLDFKKAQEDGTIKFVPKMNCACGAEQPIHFANTDRFGLQIDSYVCEKCGLIYTSPVLSPDSIKPFYENHYHHMHFGSPPSPDKTLYKKGQGKKIYDLLKRWFDSNEINVLEVGCGSGSVIKEFIKAAVADGHKAKGIGLEYSHEYVECFDPEGLNVKILNGDLHNLDPSPRPYNVIIMSHVFEHFLEPHMELQALKQFINEQTLVFIEIPGIFSLKYRYEYDCDYLKYFTFAHIYNFNLTSLTNLLNNNGFGLLWGNEEVEGIFLLGEQRTDTSENKTEVISYLRDLETNKMYFSRLPEIIVENSQQITMNSHEIKKLVSDMQYVKSFVDKILSTFPFNLVNNVRKFFKKQKLPTL
ncbi:MAG: class I SAM-dependent methyltransferase [Thermodesulfobacteriota bacterium]